MTARRYRLACTALTAVVAFTVTLGVGLLVAKQALRVAQYDAETPLLAAGLLAVYAVLSFKTPGRAAQRRRRSAGAAGSVTAVRLPLPLGVGAAPGTSDSPTGQPHTPALGPAIATRGRSGSTSARGRVAARAARGQVAVVLGGGPLSVPQPGVGRRTDLPELRRGQPVGDWLPSPG